MQRCSASHAVWRLPPPWWALLDSRHGLRVGVATRRRFDLRSCPFLWCWPSRALPVIVQLFRSLGDGRGDMAFVYYRSVVCSLALLLRCMVFPAVIPPSSRSFQGTSASVEFVVFNCSTFYCVLDPIMAIFISIYNYSAFRGKVSTPDRDQPFWVLIKAKLFNGDGHLILTLRRIRSFLLGVVLHHSAFGGAASRRCGDLPCYAA